MMKSKARESVLSLLVNSILNTFGTESLSCSRAIFEDEDFRRHILKMRRFSSCSTGSKNFQTIITGSGSYPTGSKFFHWLNAEQLQLKRDKELMLITQRY